MHHSRGDGRRQEHDIRDERNHRPDAPGVADARHRRRAWTVDLVFGVRFHRCRRRRAWAVDLVSGVQLHRY
eukprot:3401538-Pleurochrysis_carterae.AAC.1